MPGPSFTVPGGSDPHPPSPRTGRARILTAARVMAVLASAGLFADTAAAQSPAVSLTSTTQQVRESSIPFSVPVGRTTTSGNVNVVWHAENLTPAAGSFFAPVRGVLSIPDGSVSSAIQITVMDDAVFTTPRKIKVILVSVDAGHVLGQRVELLVTVVDDEPPPTFTVDPASLSANESAGVAQVRILRSGDMTRTVVMNYTVGHPWSNYVPVAPSSGTLTFGPGEIVKTIPVHIIDDDVYRPNSTAYIELKLPSDGGAVISTGSYDSYFHTATFRIVDNDSKITATMEDVEVWEDQTFVSVKLRFSQPALSSGYFYMTIADGSAARGLDFKSSDYTYLQWSAGATQATIQVPIIGDAIAEEDEQFSVTIWPGYDTTYAFAKRTGTVTILDDDPALVPGVIRTSKHSVTSALLNLGKPRTADVSIGVRSTNAGVAQVPSSVRIPAGTRRIGIPITTGVPGHAIVTVDLPDGKTLSAGVGVHDEARLVVSPASVRAYAGESVTLRVALDPPAASPAPITLAAGNASLITIPASVEIPPGGTGLIVVRTLGAGGTTITAKLPEEYGGALVAVMVDIENARDGATLTRINPITGPGAGGTAFEANGSGLTSDCTLLFGGVPALGTTVADTGLIKGITPAHAAGTVDVQLECGTSRFVLTNAFTYVASAPSLRSITPSFGSATGGTHVRAIGANLYSGCWLFFGDAPARGAVTAGTGEITALAPPGKARSADVVVRCGEASSRLQSAFTYTSAEEPSPSITSVDPLVGAAGQRVTITGARFRPGDRVTFDSTPSTIVRTAPDAHIVLIPELRLGKTSITLTDSSGRVTTTGPIFTIIEPTAPQIATATPTRAFAGSEVTLEGAGFRPGYTFAIGGREARVVSLDYTRVLIRLASDTPAGDARIEVVNAARQLAAIGPTVSVAMAGPAATSIFPQCGSSEGGTPIAILGKGFASGATIALNGVASPATVISANEIRTLAPAAATGAARVVITNPNGDSTSLSDAFRYVSPFDPDGCISSRGRTVRH